MVISIDKLDNTEIKQVLKYLPIKSIRKPVLDNIKLEKKYISGYRVANVTYIQLSPMYCSEIRLGNLEIIQTFKSSIRRYFDENGIYEYVEQLKKDTSWTGCSSFAIGLGRSDCKMPFNLIYKICELDLSDEKQVFIVNLSEMIEEDKQKFIIERNEVINNFQQINNEYESLKKEIGKYEKKLQKSNSENEVINKKVLEKEQELALCESSLEKMKMELEETKDLKEKSDKYSMECESTIASINNEKIDLKEKIKTITSEKEEYIKKFEMAEQQNQLKYNEIINRLVKDTVNDIKDDYEIDQKQFETIIESTGEENGILNVWEKISRINAEIISDIEATMRSRIIDISVVDRCNEVENNILVKYIIVKAIKSIYYEHLSITEKNKKLGDPHKSTT